MLDATDGAGETAISYTDQFLEAAIKKIDKLFGKGFAAGNPLLVQGYIQACATNLSTFIQASIAMQANGEFDALLGGLEEDEKGL